VACCTALRPFLLFQLSQPLNYLNFLNSLLGPMRYPVTPDGRYFVVRGRLWRCSSPELSSEQRQALTRELMRARAAKGRAMNQGDASAKEEARAAVDRAKIALGERGPVWWTDGAPDYNRHLVKNTPYREWFDGLAEQI
jgi:hypothetical protein